MISADSVEVVMNQGLVGDRYFYKEGHYSNSKPFGPGREITLIENEVIESVNNNYKIDLSPIETRRNILTNGVNLNDVVRKHFMIGSVLFKGIRLCPPCKHLNKITGKELLEPLKNRGGLRADVLSNGIINKGDMITITKPL